MVKDTDHVASLPLQFHIPYICSKKNSETNATIKANQVDLPIDDFNRKSHKEPQFPPLTPNLDLIPRQTRSLEKLNNHQKKT